MGKSVSTDQSHAIMAALATNVDWAQLNPDLLQEQVVRNATEAGRHFTAFLKAGARLVSNQPTIITIDRSQPFDLAKFIGPGWFIEEQEQDQRSLALTKVDLAKVELITCLKPGEAQVGGEERLKRLKQDGRIRLDAKIFQTLWENQSLIPGAWKEKMNGNTTYIYFDGTPLRNPRGSRYALCLYWRDGQLDWCYRWLEYGWGSNAPSAVLAAA